MQLTGYVNSNAASGNCKLCGTSCVGPKISASTTLTPKGRPHWDRMFRFQFTALFFVL